MTVKVSLPLKMVEGLQGLGRSVGKHLVFPCFHLLQNKASHPSESDQQRFLTLGISLLIHFLVLFFLGSAVVLTHSLSKNSFRSVSQTNMDIMTEPTENPTEDEVTDPMNSEPSLESVSSGGNSPAPDEKDPDGAPYSGDFLTLSAPGTFSITPSPGGLPSGLGSGSGDGNGSGRSGSGKGKKLFGMDVQTTNQGILVVLDTSGSMEPAAAKVRALVEENFPDATIITAKGALFATEKSITKMRKDKGGSDFYASYYSNMLDYSIIPLVNQWLSVRSTPPESIYFFSDFADYVDSSAVKDFAQMLLDKKIKFFAHSVGKEPDSSISRLCKNTGGQELREK